MMSFDLLGMEQGELCHDRRVLLLADCIQDIGATKPNVRARGAGSVLAVCFAFKRQSHNWTFYKIGCLFFEIIPCPSFFSSRFRIVRCFLKYGVW